MTGSAERQSIREPIRPLRPSVGIGKGSNFFAAADCAHDADGAHCTDGADGADRLDYAHEADAAHSAR